jgi:hypothetical protein
MRDVHNHTASRSTGSLFLQQTEKVDALRALNGHTKRTVPDELDQRSEGTTDAEGNGVVKRLLETIVVEENARGGVDIGVGILGLERC